MKNGFTLAEVLITLAVIGVIATLTLPNIIGNYQNKVLITQLQKTLNTLNNAALKAMQEEVEKNFLNLVNTSEGRQNFLKKYFDAVTICDSETGYENCLATRYTNFNKTGSYNVSSSSLGVPDVKCAATTSGATICIGGKHYWVDDRNTVRTFVIDINGVKGPNITGKDFFYVGVAENGKLNYNVHPANNDSFENAMQRESAGELCTTDGDPHPFTIICLPYIISHGWQFKF